MKKAYLTKSKFINALDCPRKLYYATDRMYANSNNHDEFLKYLAGGGYQVGTLTKLLFPGGTDLSAITDHEQAVRTTKKLMKQKNCIIYEAAFMHSNLFVRVDVLVKEGKKITFYESKSKCWDELETNELVKVSKTGKKSLYGDYKKYVYDAVFQKYVMQKALPDKVIGHLLFVDKNKEATVDGLNQKFKLIRDDQDRYHVEMEEGLTSQDLGESLLIAKPIQEAYEVVMSENHVVYDHEEGFEQLIQRFSKEIADPASMNYAPIGPKCAKCEFRNINNESEKKCGFTECHVNAPEFKDQPERLAEPLTYTLNGGGNTQLRGKIIREGHFFLHEIPQNYFQIPAGHELQTGMHYNHRKLKQIEFSKNPASEPYVLHDALGVEMADWKYPYHFIDFETIRPAIPFYNGGRPYSQVAFQFSHHVMDENGQVEHRGEWINFEEGRFPNFDFMRQLKNELEHDNGTIFVYSHHENSVLRDIRAQLLYSNESDKVELIDFIDTITQGDDTIGIRNMVDLLKVLKKYYIHPDMKGSNSLKYVLPAVLNGSRFLQEKYGAGDGRPLYGNSIPSKNFPDGKAWAVKDDTGRFIDPYKLLDPFQVCGHSSDEFQDTSDEDDSGEAIMNGGAAMFAYQELQFSHIPPERKLSIRKALLRYCELDTLAMVMLVEAWRELCSAASQSTSSMKNSKKTKIQIQ